MALLAPAVFGVGVAADELLARSGKLRRISMWLMLGLACVCVFFSDRMRRRAADPDMVAIFGEVAKLDPHVFVSYRATDLYVLGVLLKDAVEEDNSKRQVEPRMLLLLHDNFISAVHADDPPIEEPVAPNAAPLDEGYVVPGEDVRFWLYRLRPLTSGETLEGKAVLCFSDDTIPDDMKHWLFDNCGIVNSMLFSPGISHICYGFPGTDLTADMLLEMEEAAGSGLFFRVVTD